VSQTYPSLPRRGGGFAALFAALLAFVFAATAVAAEPLKFPPLTGRVVDDAHLLSPHTTQKLTSELAALEQQTGHQLVVATVPDLQGHEIEDFGYQLGRTWQLGKKGVNDGAILLVAPSEHKVRIEVGYGLEPELTDALTNIILQRKVLPQFKQGHMEQGVVDGAEALIAQLGLPEDQARAAAAQAQAETPVMSSQGRDVGSHVPVLFIILVIVWVISALMRRGGGGLWWLPFLFMGGGGGDRWSGGGDGGGGGFSGGGGSFGGGGSSGSW
jgi:uncharacterized protein